MAIIDTLKFYDKVQDDLKLQNMSNVRIKIMISLSEGAKKIDDLQKLTGILSFTILRSIGELEKHNLVLNDGDYYHLSGIGKERASELIDMIRTLTVLKNNEKLWLDHEIDTIPNDLLMKIGDLYNSRLVETENTNIDKVYEIYTRLVLNAKEIKGVSPIFRSDLPKIYMDILEKGTKVELILTEPILRKTIESVDKMENLDNLLSINNLTLWKTKEDVKVGLTVTDNCLSLGLFSSSGEYDMNKDLISDNEAAVAWGNKLFNYYLKMAHKVNLEDFVNILGYRKMLYIFLNLLFRRAKRSFASFISEH